MTVKHVRRMIPILMTSLWIALACSGGAPGDGEPDGSSPREADDGDDPGNGDSDSDGDSDTDSDGDSDTDADGDADSDGMIQLNDPILVLQYLFLNIPFPCQSAGDTNDDGALDIADPIYSLSWLFAGGDSPLPPTPSRTSYPPEDCGLDPTPDNLPCDLSPPGCE